MTTKPEPTIDDLVRRLFNVPASRPCVRYGEALQNIGSRGQRHETRERYLEQVVLAGKAFVVFIYGSGVIRAWLDKDGKHEVENFDIYLATDGTCTRDRKKADPRGEGEYYLPTQIQAQFAASFTAETEALKEERREAARKHAEGPAGHFERRLRKAIGMEDSHLISVFDHGEPDDVNRRLSVTMYLTQQQADFVTRAVEQFALDVAEVTS